MHSNEISILVTEYFVSIFNPGIANKNSFLPLSEACGMVLYLINTLKKSGFRVYSTISQALIAIFKHIIKDSDRVEFIPITNPDKYFDQIDVVKNQVDYVIAIAPPLQLTTLADIVKNKLLGPSATTVKMLSSKFEAMNILRRYGAKVPNTVMCCEYEKCDLSDLSTPLIIKPSMLAGSECVYLVDDLKDVEKYLKKAIDCDPMHCAIVQEYIRGYHGSVSALFLNNELLTASLNLQLVMKKSKGIEYRGSVLPLRNRSLVYKALGILSRLKSIKDLNGYIGLDVVWNDDIYVVEVNPRFTTSGIGLIELYPNLGQIMLGLNKPRSFYIGFEVEGYAYVIKNIFTDNAEYEKLCLEGLSIGKVSSLNEAVEIIKRIDPNLLSNLLYDFNSILVDEESSISLKPRGSGRFSPYLST